MDVNDTRYKAENQRLLTFAKWPKRDVVKPEVLAAAGFIYLGEGDMVVCVFCSGKLRTWESGCIPLQDHKRFFPSCPFVAGEDVGNIPLGQEHRQRGVNATGINVLKDLAATQSPAARVESRVDEQSSSSATRKPENVTPQMAPLYAVDPREVRARLDTPRVRNLLAVGYTVAELTQAIEQRLRTCGNDFTSLNDFVAALQGVRAANNGVKSGANGTSAATDVSATSRHNGDANSHTAEASAGAGVHVNQTAAPPSKPKKKKNKKKNGASSYSQLAIEEEIRAAMEENRQLLEARQCKVCLDESIAVVFLPCGHACTCTGCAAAVTHCSLCRHFIRGTVKIAV